VDTIRNGTAPASIRRKGAEGSLPISLQEKIEVLAVLTRDGDEGIRAKAIQTFSNWNLEELQLVLSNPQTTLAVLESAKNLLAPDRKELLASLLRNPDLSDVLRGVTSAPLPVGLKPAGENSLPAPPPSQPSAHDAEGADSEESLTLLQIIARMSPSEKVRAALSGTQETRMILVRDSNKFVARAVLQSPKLSDVEIETFASMKDLGEEVLRLIATNRNFVKSYTVIKALINNPRVPTDATLPLLTRLNDRDLRSLMKNRNVPEAIRLTAVKMVRQKEEAARAKLSVRKG
jgi:hypothetical protein